MLRGGGAFHNISVNRRLLRHGTALKIRASRNHGASFSLPIYSPLTGLALQARGFALANTRSIKVGCRRCSVAGYDLTSGWLAAKQMDDLDAAVEKRRIVLRAGNGYWSTGVVAAIFLFFLASAIIQGAALFVVQALPWSLLVLWLLYLILIRPCVILVPGTITVINILRRYSIAWSAVEKVGTRFQMIIFLTGDRRITSMGAPSPTNVRPSRAGRKGAGMGFGYTRKSPGGPPSDQVVESAMTFWAQHEPENAGQPDLVASWDLRGLIPLVVLVALCAIEVVVGLLAH
jgi:hypothetical protein